MGRKLKLVLWGGVCAIVLALSGLGVWILTLPAAPAAATAPAVPESEAQAAVAALESSRRERPLIAVVGINDATETTDYLMTYGVLRRADVADVTALATEPGPVQLYPALRVEPDATIAEFDARHPEGADYVIVPAMSRDDDPVILQWLQSQAAKGATVIGVCVGAKVVAAAGLLDGRKATTHWYVLDGLLERYPAIQYVADRRFVVEQGVATTTGITASMPMMLTLVESIAGRTKAEAVAQSLGSQSWDARHASGQFLLTRPFALTVLGNVLSFWKREQIGLALHPGIDEISLALAADAWSRTYRSRAMTFAESPVETRGGIRVLPDLRTAAWTDGPVISTIENRRPVEALDDTLRAIAERYGESTAEIVAMQLEYPKRNWKAKEQSR